MNKPLTVFIIDDHPIIRDGLQALLGEQGQDLAVIGSARDAHDALKQLRYLSPEVIVLDVALPQLSGLDTVAQLRQLLPHCQVVVFSMHEKEAYVHRALSAGALGYVVKGSPITELIDAIRAAHAGEYYLSSRMKREVFQSYLKNRQAEPAEPSGYDLLSEREQQIFRLLVAGSSTQQISAALELSPKTVEKHRTSIGRKLGTRSLVDMVKQAVQLGIIDPDTWKA